MNLPSPRNGKEYLPDTPEPVHIELRVNGQPVLVRRYSASTLFSIRKQSNSEFEAATTLHKQIADAVLNQAGLPRTLERCLGGRAPHKSTHEKNKKRKTSTFRP